MCLRPVVSSSSSSDIACPLSLPMESYTQYLGAAALQDDPRSLKNPHREEETEEEGPHTGPCVFG